MNYAIETSDDEKDPNKRVLRMSKDFVFGTLYSNNGKWLVIQTYHFPILVLDAQTHECIRELNLNGHVCCNSHLCFSSDDQWLATLDDKPNAGQEIYITVYNTRTWEPTYLKYAAVITTVAYDGCGTFHTRANCVTFIPNTHRLCIGGYPCVHVYDLKENESEKFEYVDALGDEHYISKFANSSGLNKTGYTECMAASLSGALVTAYENVIRLWIWKPEHRGAHMEKKIKIRKRGNVQYIVRNELNQKWLVLMEENVLLVFFDNLSHSTSIPIDTKLKSVHCMSCRDHLLCITGAYELNKDEQIPAVYVYDTNSWDLLHVLKGTKSSIESAITALCFSVDISPSLDRVVMTSKYDTVVHELRFNNSNQLDD